MLVKLIGLSAAVLTTAAFIPQAVKTWKTKSTEDLSPIMFIFFCFGILLWLIYGICLKDLPMICANSVTIILAGTILFYILKPVKSNKIAHIALWTNNLEDMKTFYVVHFGAKAGKIYLNPSKGFSSYFLSFSTGIRIELMHQEVQTSHSAQWGHVAIALGSKNNVDKLTQELSDKGIKVVQKPRQTGDGYYESVIEDIEGNRIELTI